MLLLEDVKEGKGLEMLTANKLLNRILILLAQIHNSNRLIYEIRQTLHLLCQHNEITKNIYSNVIKSL